MSRRCCCLSVLVIVGFVLVVLGVVFIPVSKKIIHNEITEQINLKNKDTEDKWTTNPTPIYFKAYVWDLTNPGEVQAGIGKPHLKQKGPFVYKESRQKVNITFNDHNGTVTYREKQFFSFVPEMSFGPENTTFTTINIPMMTFANIVLKEPGLVQMAAEALLIWSKEQLFMKLTVGDLVWGYEEPLLKKGSALAAKLGFNISDKFGLFTNGSDDGVYNIMTGATDVSQFGKIKTWNYNPTLDFWTTNQSNLINGTDGTIFHPFVDKSDTFYVFSSDICRSIYVTFLETNSHLGIDTYRFTAPASVFLNSTANPSNQGFCYPSKNCLPSGLINVENCRDGAPVVFSSPHFLYADPKVINAVIGMSPDPDKHQTVIDIEPNTGAAFYAAKRLQVNVQMEQVNHIPLTANLSHTVLPVLWIEESSTITQDLANTFKSQLQTPLEAIHVGIYVAIGVGAALVVFTMLYILGKKYFSKNLTDYANLITMDDMVENIQS